MAKVYLDSGETFNLGSSATVFGAGGTEDVLVNSGVSGVIVDQNVERVDLSAATSGYTYQQAGNTLRVYSGTTLIASIPVQGDADGTQVAFTNGSASAKLTAAGVLTLGGATVPSAAPGAVTPTTISTAPEDFSKVNNPTQPPYTLSADTVYVAEGATVNFTLKAITAPTTDQLFHLTFAGDTNGGTVSAASAADFTTLPTTVTLKAGETTATFAASPLVDNITEGIEGFKFNVLDPTGVAVGTGTPVALITDTNSTPPVVTAPTAPFAYNENQSANYVVGTVVATDDVGVTGYSLDAATTAAGYFAIDATGKITLTAAGAALTAPSNDFETSPNTFTLGVTASDAAGNVSPAVNFTVNVRDVDDTAPKLVAATGVGTTVNLNFDEPLKNANLNGTAFSVVDAANANITVNSVTVSGPQVILVLAQPPSGAVKVSYTPPATGDVLQDTAGNKVLPIVSQPAVSDVTAPTLASSTPADGEPTFVAGNNLVLNFSEDVVPGTGNITIVNAGDAADTRTISIKDDAQVSRSGAVITIDPKDNLKFSAAYYVTIGNTAVLDKAGNAYAGIANPTTLNFTTAPDHGTEGQTFSLTTSVDTIPGLIGTAGTTSTAGDDTIIAGEGSSAGVHTLGSSDIINAGPGMDKMEVKLVEFGAGAFAVQQQVTPRITSVEKLYVQALGTPNVADISNIAVAGVSLINATGTTEVWSDNSTDDLAVTNMTEKATIGVKSGVAVAPANFTVAATTAVARTGDLAIVLDKAKVNNLYVNATGAAGAAGYTSTTINAVAGTTVADRNTVTTLDVGNTLATVTVAGDGALTVTNNLAPTVRTITATANKGGANFNITNNTGNVTYTGGEGADRINFGGTLNLADKVDGGAARDTLAVTNQGIVVTGLQVSNIEILELATLDGALDASLIAGVDEVQVTTVLSGVPDTAVVNNLAGNATFVTNTNGEATLNIKNAQVAGTIDTLNLKTNIAGAAGNVIIKAPGVETIAYTQNNIAAPAGTNVTTLTFKDNDGVIDVTKLIIANTAGNTVNFRGLVNTIKTVDAAAAAGLVNVTIDTGNPTNGVEITGGSGADSLVGGDGKDVIKGNAGNDMISGDQYTTILGTGGAAIPQVSTINIANAEVGDIFTINGNAVVWTGVEATDNAAVTAAAATAGVNVAFDGLADPTAGTFTMTGPAAGTPFLQPVVAATNVAAQPEVSTVTIDASLAYDAGDVLTVTIGGTNYSYTAVAGDSANTIATALQTQINGGAAMTAAISGFGNVLTLTGNNATTNYTVTAAISAQVAATQQPQITTVALGGSLDTGDTYSVNVNGTVYTGDGTAALAAAIGTAGGTIASSVATSATVLTLNGLADGTAFTVAAGGATNFAGSPEVTTVTINDIAYDADDVLQVIVNGVTFSGLAGQTATQQATTIGSAITASGLMLASPPAVVGATVVFTLTGVTNNDYTVTTAIAGNAANAGTAQVDTIVLDNGAGGNNDLDPGDIVQVGINGTTVNYTITGTAATDANGLVNAINVAGLGVTAAFVDAGGAGLIVNDGDSMTLTANTVGTPFTTTLAVNALPPAEMTVSTTTPNVPVTTANPAADIVAAETTPEQPAGTADETITVALIQPGVAVSTVVNPAPVAVDNTFTPAGLNTQTIVAATPTLGQAADNQYVTGVIEADILTGGAGNDVFVVLGSGLGNGTTFPRMDSITDLDLGGSSFSTRVDTIDLNLGVASTVGSLVNAGVAVAMTAAPDLSDAVDVLFAAGGVLNAQANKAGLFTYAGDSYIIVAGGTAAAAFGADDVIIKVTGMTGTLDLTDFI